MKELLKAFLKTKKVWYRWKEYTKNDRDNKNAKVFLETEFFENYISHAFDWENTPEGEEFWSNINEEWKAIIDIVIIGVKA